MTSGEPSPLAWRVESVVDRAATRRLEAAVAIVARWMELWDDIVQAAVARPVTVVVVAPRPPENVDADDPDAWEVPVITEVGDRAEVRLGVPDDALGGPKEHLQNWLLHATLGSLEGCAARWPVEPPPMPIYRHPDEPPPVTIDPADLDEDELMVLAALPTGSAFGAVTLVDDALAGAAERSGVADLDDVTRYDTLTAWTIVLRPGGRVPSRMTDTDDGGEDMRDDGDLGPVLPGRQVIITDVQRSADRRWLDVRYEFEPPVLEPPEDEDFPFELLFGLMSADGDGDADDTGSLAVRDGLFTGGRRRVRWRGRGPITLEASPPGIDDGPEPGPVSLLHVREERGTVVWTVEILPPRTR